MARQRQPLNDGFSRHSPDLPADPAPSAGGTRSGPLQTEYDKHTDADGGFAPTKILEVWPADTRLRISGGVFQSQRYWGGGLPIRDLPVMIAFRHPQAGTHMNVIFNQKGRTVMAMEPYFPFPGQNGKRTGQIVERNVDFYVKDNYGKIREIILFWPTITM